MDEMGDTTRYLKSKSVAVGDVQDYPTNVPFLLCVSFLFGFVRRVKEDKRWSGHFVFAGFAASFIVLCLHRVFQGKSLKGKDFDVRPNLNKWHGYLGKRFNTANGSIFNAAMCDKDLGERGVVAVSDEE